MSDERLVDLRKEDIKELFDDKVNQCKQCRQLEEKYGLTERYDHAGFIMPSGEMISSYINGHAQHEEMVPDHGKLIKYLKDCCDIRFRKQNKRIWVEAECRPTPEQVAKIVEATRDCNVFYAYGPNECLLGLSNPRPLDVQRWVSKCWTF